MPRFFVAQQSTTSTRWCTAFRRQAQETPPYPNSLAHTQPVLKLASTADSRLSLRESSTDSQRAVKQRHHKPSLPFSHHVQSLASVKPRWGSHRCGIACYTRVRFRDPLLWNSTPPGYSPRWCTAFRRQAQETPPYPNSLAHTQPVLKLASTADSRLSLRESSTGSQRAVKQRHHKPSLTFSHHVQSLASVKTRWGSHWCGIACYTRLRFRDPLLWNSTPLRYGNRWCTAFRRQA